MAPDSPALSAIDAEVQVLGACLLDARAAEYVLEHVRETDCYQDKHGRILNAIRHVVSVGDTPDAVTLAHHLAAHKALAEVGGAAYLDQLLEQTPTAALVKQHVSLVLESATRRRIRRATLQAAQEAGDPAVPLSDILRHLTEDVEAAGDATEPSAASVRIDVALQAWLASWEQGPTPCIPIGYAKLDEALGGGTEPGDLLILGGRAGSGKTAMTLEIARRTAEAGKGVLFVSREMQLNRLIRRFLAQTGKVSATRLKMGRLLDHEYPKYEMAYSRLSRLPIWLNDRVRQLEQITRAVKRWPYTPALGLVIVDYLQLIRAPRDIKDRRLQVEAVSSGLKDLAMQTSVPVIAVSALSRPEKGAHDRRPVLQDLRESGEIEHDADIVLFVHRPIDETGLPGMTAEAIIAKARDGATGKTTLQFRGEWVSFEQAEGE